MNSKEEKDQEFEESMKKCEKAIRELSKEQRTKMLQYLLDEERWHKTLHL